MAKTKTVPKKKSVLIIEDDPEMRDLITFMLQGEYRIAGQARDGNEGIRLAAGQHPDVIVLDYVLPYMDGAQIGETIRLEDPDVKIVAFSATDQARTVLTEKWADFFLPKSRVVELPLVVRHLADQHVSRR
jgi:CheY-like chemotaxis protein